ncbi:SprT family zinc-dependent metalloprotease [Clostridium sp.]|uniref:M48 family metallopeptidase n=1 Tax=Clostridium sp. TaxID=1506 RepID=UPI00258C568A|nr:SprT family zinc-dependent metalloprotease [Clostridium sp.]MDF2503610.1 putative metal-dependent hydrolase [Clostridium sp.]
MKLKIRYAGEDIEVQVLFSKRKTMGISIEPTGDIKVRSPIGIPEDVIIEMVKGKAAWISKKLYYFKHRPYQSASREFVTGELFMYLGRECPMWYREMAKEEINKRVSFYQKYFNMKPSEIKVKEQKRRWGSCTYKDSLLFNWRCVMAKESVLDYIVVHEMCHMVHKNHSKEYWKAVASILPDYKQREQWLKYNGAKMDL